MTNFQQSNLKLQLIRALLYLKYTYSKHAILFIWMELAIGETMSNLCPLKIESSVLPNPSSVPLASNKQALGEAAALGCHWWWWLLLPASSPWDACLSRGGNKGLCNPTSQFYAATQSPVFIIKATWGQNLPVLSSFPSRSWAWNRH